MKIVFSTAIAAIALSTLIWTYFKIQTPDAPLTEREMVLVVGVCLVASLLVQGIWRLIRKGGKN